MNSTANRKDAVMRTGAVVIAIAIALTATVVLVSAPNSTAPSTSTHGRMPKSEAREAATLAREEARLEREAKAWLAARQVSNSWSKCETDLETFSRLIAIELKTSPANARWLVLNETRRAYDALDDIDQINFTAWAQACAKWY